MATKTYYEKLKDPRWQKKRLKIMERDDFCCQRCGESELTLNVHHLSYGKNPWDVEDSELITLCEDCHKEFTEYKAKINKLLSLNFRYLHDIHNILQKIEEYKIPIYSESKLVRLIDLIFKEDDLPF